MSMGESVTFERNSDHDGKWLRNQFVIERKSSIALEGMYGKIRDMKSEYQTEKGFLSRKVLFAVAVIVSSHLPRRLGVVEEKSSVVALPVVNEVSILGNAPEAVWLILWSLLCPNHVVVVFSEYV